MKVDLFSDLFMLVLINKPSPGSRHRTRFVPNQTFMHTLLENTFFFRKRNLNYEEGVSQCRAQQDNLGSTGALCEPCGDRIWCIRTGCDQMTAWISNNFGV